MADMVVSYGMEDVKDVSSLSGAGIGTVFQIDIG
jgi:hypothetical protein